MNYGVYSRSFNQIMLRFVLALLCVISSTALYAEAVLYPMYGSAIPFSQLQGKWVLINYWASWCQPCLNEIPELNQFYAQHKNENLALFGVNYDMLPPKMQEKLMVEHHIEYPALIKDPSTSLNLGDIRGVPVTFVFNPQGVLTETLYGGLTNERLNKIIQFK